MPSAEPISWNTAERVAARVSGFEPFSASYLADSLEDDLEVVTRRAEQLVEQETGLHVGSSARVRVTDRSGWTKANIASFRRLLRPLTDRISQRRGHSLISSAGATVTGAQVGAVLGWMSTRVLGQYDILLLEDERPEDQDIIYYVAPNVLALEKRYAFPPGHFRLWLALHECAHRAQFMGVSWLAPYFRSQVRELLELSDPERLSGAIKRATDELRAGHNPIADGGVLALLASPEQRAALSKILGLMALLEGHGEVTMSRAGGDLDGDAERFHRVLHARRRNANNVSRVVQKLLGLDAKMRQYAEGERFVRDVEREGGRELFRLVWERPEMLPTYDEIRDPKTWIARARPAGVGAGSF